MLEERPKAITVARVWVRENIITTVLGVFIVISLLLHAVTLLALVRVRDVVRLQLAAAAAQVAEARTQQIHYDFPIKQTFPFSTTVAINETLDVPIQDNFPIKQTFDVPLDLNTVIPGAGVYTFPVPLDITIPVSTTVKVTINKQIPISTDITVDTVVPLDIDLQQPPLGDLLQRIERSLRDLLGQL